MKANIGVIGFGNMGRAFALALARSRQRAVLVYEKNPKKRRSAKNIRFSRDIKTLVSNCGIIILAVKPKDFKSLLNRSKKYLSGRHLIVSIAAGIPTDFFNAFVKKPRVIRAMPNLAANVNESVTFLCKGRFAGKKDLETAKKIFLSAGEVIVTEESRLNKVTALSGSGPGYIFYFMESIYKSALKMGFKPQDAKKAVVQIFWGAAKLAKKSDKSFKALAEEVASKGGTTEAALKTFQGRKLDKIIAEGIKNAQRKAQELSKK